MCLGLYHSRTCKNIFYKNLVQLLREKNTSSKETVFVQVALKGMFQQANQLVKFWKLSKTDAVIWVVTFFVVTLINIDIGLLAGLFVSLIIILLQVIRPYTCLLGHIPHTDLYLDMGRYKAVRLSIKMNKKTRAMNQFLY